MMSKIITITGFGILGIVSLLGIYLVSTHPIVSQHIGKATAIIIFLVIIFVLYILDRRDINAKWNLFTKELDGNKTNFNWLNEKRRYLYNAQHTNIFRSRLQKRMLNECEISIEKLKIEQSIDSQIQELKSKITYLENENDSLKQVQSSSNIKLNEATFSKIDFYKIINVLCELNAFEALEGKTSKKEVFEILGKGVNLDTKTFQNNLSQGYDAKKDEEIFNIFYRMIEQTKRIIEKKNS